MKFGSKATASIASEIQEGIHHKEDDQLGKPALDATLIDQLVSRLGHAVRGGWDKAYGQVIERFYQDFPTGTAPGIAPGQTGNQLITITVPPKSNNQLILNAILVIYDPSMTLLWLAVGAMDFPLVPRPEGYTWLPDINGKLTSGSGRALQVISGGSPSRLGLVIFSTDTMQDGRS